jgi:hypothetical protein
MIGSLIRRQRGLKKFEWVKAAAVIALCGGLSTYAPIVRAGNGFGSSGSALQPALSLSVQSLSFGNQTAGTQSGAKTVTLTNKTKAAVKITSIGVTGNFAETNTCGTSLKAGAVCTISTTFKPPTSGALNGALGINDSSAGNEQFVALTGTGTKATVGGGGGGTGTGGGTGGAPTGPLACASTVITQEPADITSELTYVNAAAGVKVSQLTDNGMNRFYYFDVPAYSAPVNQILYVNFAIGNEIATSNTDGTSAQIISPTLTGAQSFLSGDGTLAYYPKQNRSGAPGGEDIYGVFLNKTGTCEEIQLTYLDVAPMSPLPMWEISTASLDAAGGEDIAFSPDTVVHRVHVETNGTSVVLPTITMDDPENAGTFHRLRLNPKFPNIVMYKRNGTLGGTTAEPETWLVDLNTCPSGTCPASEITNIVAKLVISGGRVPKAGHINWSPDGLDILFGEPDIADYWIARNVVNSNGTINKGFTLQELGPFVKPQMTADYCAFPPNWPTETIVACLAGPASPQNAKTFYLMTTDGKGTTKLLAASDAQVLTMAGTPMPQFAQDGQHLMFNSDRTGLTQIYMIKGFTLSVP